MTAAVVLLETEEQVREVVGLATVAAFQDASAERQRSPWAMSPSRLGGCTRAGAYALARTPVSDDHGPEEGRAANLGTGEHEFFLPRFVARLGQLLGVDGASEVPVELHADGLTMPGSIDALAGIVVDLKTVGEHRLHGVRRHGIAFEDHRMQVRGYALARLQSGHPVDWLVWLYMDRASGDFEVIVERFTNESALSVIDRVRELNRWSQAPDQAPRATIAGPERGPGKSFACDRCPWLRRCWGQDAVPGQVGAQRNLAVDAPAVAAALALYDDAAARAGRAEKDREYAAAILAGSRRGRYDEWSLRWSSSSSRIDSAAAVARLVELGEPVPQMRVDGHALVRLTSKLTKKMIAQIDAPDEPDGQ